MFRGDVSSLSFLAKVAVSFSRYDDESSPAPLHDEVCFAGELSFLVGQFRGSVELVRQSAVAPSALDVRNYFHSAFYFFG